jgi:hypothetical protein
MDKPAFYRQVSPSLAALAKGVGTSLKNKERPALIAARSLISLACSEGKRQRVLHCLSLRLSLLYRGAAGSQTIAYKRLIFNQLTYSAYYHSTQKAHKDGIQAKKQGDHLCHDRNSPRALPMILYHYSFYFV